MTNNRLNELTSDLWEQIEKSGYPSSGEVISLIAALLFLKWVEHIDVEREAAAEVEGVPCELSLPNELRWSSLQTLRGKVLLHAIQRELVPALRNPRPSNFSHYLPAIGTIIGEILPDGMIEVPSLDWIIEWPNIFDFTSTPERELAGEVLEKVFYKSVKQGHSAEFFTPPSIIKLMVDLVDPKPGDRIYDPCFGSGGFLVETARRLKETSRRFSPEKWHNIQENSIFGIEKNPVAYTIGLTRLTLEDITKPGLELGDTLLRPMDKKTAREKFDCIFANPPWSIKVSREHTYNLPYNLKDSEAVFLYHIMSSLRPGGRAAVLVPEGLLFWSGPTRRLREDLLTKFRVKSIISLHSGIFLPYSSIKTSILFFKKQRPAKTVHFIKLDDSRPTCAMCGAMGSAGSFEIHHATALSKGGPASFNNLQFVCLKCHRAINDKSRQEAAVYGSDTQARTSRGYFEGGERTERKRPKPISWDTPLEELSKRNWELIVKESGSDLIDKLLKRIYDADPSIQKLTLVKVADVITGVRYGKDTAIRDSRELNTVPIIRISDIREKRILLPNLFLTEKGKSQITDKQYLRANDLLISVSGNVGKIGYVQEESQQRQKTVFANSVVVIRPKETVLPDYLMSLLQSESYQKWLSGNARGSTVQHLSVDTLRNLPIPLPEIPLQKRVLDEYALGANRDALEILANITASKDRLKSSLSKISSSIEGITARQRLIIRGSGSNPLLALNNLAIIYTTFDFGKGEEEEPEWWDFWKSTIFSEISLLQNVHEITEGPALYSVLKESQAHLSNLFELVDVISIKDDNEKELANKALSLSSEIESLLKKALLSLTEKTSLKASVSESTIPIGKTQEVLVKLSNLGVLPIRNIGVSTEPDIGGARIPYLAEFSDRTFPVNIPPQSDSGSFEFKVTWFGFKLDNDIILGSLNLALEVQPIRDFIQRGELGPSPYITTDPIPGNREEMFIGREKILSKIKRQFDEIGKGNIILLEGNRKSGKTSILYYLKSKDFLAGWMPVYISFQGSTGDEQKVGLPTSEIFKRMTKDIFKSALEKGIKTWFPEQDMPFLEDFKFEAEFIKTWDSKVREEDPLDIFERYLRSVFKMIAPKKLLLMLDEFEKIQDGILTGITSPQVPENLRYLFQTYSELSAILSYTKFLRRLREEYWSMLFALGYPVTVGALGEEDSRSLVTRPAEGKLIYTDEARDAIITLCARQPYLIQVFCNHVFDLAAETGERSITLTMVNQSAAEMAGDNEHFSTLWLHHLESERQRYLLALFPHLADLSDRITLKLLEIKLEEAGIFIRSMQKLGDDLNHLRALELVKMSENGTEYSLSIPLMREWIRKNHDIEDLRRRAVQENQEEL